MEPQQVLVDPVQSGEDPFKELDRSDKCIKIGEVPPLIVFREEGAVPKPVVKDGFIRVGHPEAEVGLPQLFDGAHGVGKHGQGAEF